MRKLRDGDDVVARTVTCSLRIRHLEKEHAVDSKLRIVLRDANLARRVQRHFLEAVLISDAVDEGNDDIEPRREHAVEFTETLNHPCVLLRHHLDALRDEHNGEQNEENRENQKVGYGHIRSCYKNVQCEAGSISNRVPSTRTIRQTPTESSDCCAVYAVHRAPR